jgi:ribosome-binding factor A
VSKVRTQRVADQIRQTLAEIVMRELRDPDIGFVTVTGVELSSDLRYAKAFVSLMGNESEKTASLSALRKAAPFTRRALGERIRLRHVPEIRFFEDLTESRAGRIEELIHEIQEDRPPETPEPDGDEES